MADLQSYDLNGVKESFANWVSNISPQETPFVSMTNKEALKNKYFQWQEDKLASVADNAVAEGSDATSGDLEPTAVKSNVTQILRKVVRVSDTADSLANYGRGNELAYQTEKAAKELKRDLEWAFLNNGEAVDASAPGTPTSAAGIRKTAGFQGLTAELNTASPEDPAAVVHQRGILDEDILYSVTQALYIAGAKTTHIMFHPSKAKFFSSLAEKVDGTRQRMFDGEVSSKINTYVSELVDPLGQRYCLLPNRFMPIDKIYIFNPVDWTQMVLREPSRIKLAKNGSSEKTMIEIEVGLRHKNTFASGIIDVVVPANITAAGGLQYSANGSTGWTATVPAAAKKVGAVNFYAKVSSTTPVDDGTFHYSFKLVGQPDGDGGNTAGIAGLSLSWTNNLAHVTGTIPDDQVGKTFKLEATVTDEAGTEVTSTPISFVWTE